MSYYAENVTVQIPGTLMQGRSAVREQFVRPFIAGFPGNRHIVKNWIFGRDVVVVEWTFEAEHKGPFADCAATDARVELPGCGVYEYDSAKRQITAARIYFDVGNVAEADRRSAPPTLPSTEDAAAAPTGTIAAPVEHLDLATVITVSQTVSGEMVLEKLLDTLMRTAVEHAGAERALLILSRRTASSGLQRRPQPAANGVVVQLCDEPVTGSLLPETVLRYVLHTRESVILDDAAIPNPFSTDPYIDRAPRSFGVLPAAHKPGETDRRALSREQPDSARLRAGTHRGAEAARLAGRDLAREHPLVPRSRGTRVEDPAPGRCQHHRDLHLGPRRSDSSRRTTRSSPWWGTTVEDLVAGRLHWTDLTPPEWRDRDERAGCRNSRRAGALQPFEKEYLPEGRQPRARAHRRGEPSRKPEATEWPTSST